MDTLICPICKIEKQANEYTAKSLIYKRCDACYKRYMCLQQKNYRDKNKEKYNERMRIHQQNYRSKLGPELNRSKQLKSNYGITLEEYNIKLKAQDGVCYICKKVNEDGRNLSVDHNHKTEKVRDLLCHKCNTAIGMLDEDTNRIIEIFNYLIKHSNIEKEFSFQHD